ncbi:MAG: AMP-binding protein, partial [bacterium]|nr:AMP-binding protein [bacterium]
ERFRLNKSFSGVQGAAFQKSPLVAEGKIYKTGDLARWLPDGTIEILGRIDHQVKLRGFRIEPSEVETQLLTNPEIKEAVVIVRANEEESKYLCAYIVPHSPATFAVPQLKEYLGAELPDYMMPTHFVVLDRMPLTGNGKLDRNALPQPEAGDTGDRYIAPRDPLEETLAGIWSEILGVEKEKIGIDSNFFDMGGQSMKVTILISRVQKELNIKVPQTEFFKAPFIRALSVYIKESGEYAEPELIPPAVKQDYYPLTSMQKRMYLLQQMDLESSRYNHLQLVTMAGNLEKARVEDLFRKLIDRHESLRTSFTMMEGEPVQVIHEKIPFRFEYFDLATGTDEDVSTITRQFTRPFDLSCAPVFRSGLIRRGESKHLFMIAMHHIISDAVSHSLFITDFAALYAGEELPPLKLQYKDFSVWQNSAAIKDVLARQEAYWLDQLKGEIPLLDLPIDFPRSNFRTPEGDSVHFRMTKEESDALKTLAREEGVTTFMLLFAVFNVFLSKICGQDEILAGTPIAGRVHTHLDKIIGMFANTLVLRTRPLGGKTFRDFLAEVKEKTLNAYENQEFQFEELVDKVVKRREPGRNPLFDVMFNFRSPDTVSGINATALQGLVLEQEESEERRSRFDFTMYVMDSGDHFQCSVTYNTQLFRRETIDAFSDYFREIAAAVLEDTGLDIANIEILAKETIDKMSLEFSEDLEEE